MKIVWQNALLFLSFAAYNYFCLATESQNIGALFNSKDSQATLPLESLIYQRNQIDQKVKYGYSIKEVSDTDSFTVSKTLCNLLENEGVSAIFGPTSATTSNTLESICSYFEVPYIITSWRQPKVTSENVINLFPEADLFARGLAKVVEGLHWDRFVIIYESEDGLIRMQEILKLHEYEKGTDQNKVTVHKLGPGPDYRVLLKKIKDSSVMNIILDCELENIIPILKQATEVGLLNIHHKVFLSNLDAHTLDYSLYASVNITTIRLFNPNSQHFNKAVENWNQFAENTGLDTIVAVNSIKTETALMHDAVLLFTDAVNTLSVTQPIYSNPVSCNNSSAKAASGFIIVSYMKLDEKPKRYLTGPIKFEDDGTVGNRMGNRIEFTLYVLEVAGDHVTANWTASAPDDLLLIRSDSESLQASVESLQKLPKVLVSSRIGKPYLSTETTEDGKTKFYGYSVDLIASIARILNFTFEFQLTKDNAYPNLINDLLQGRAHLAICDLTITHQRRQLVDFSMPFMNLGISILYRKAAEKEVDMFAFLDPFSIAVWIYTATLYLVVSIILFFISRMAPDDWENPHLCDENPEELENIWDIKNCFWLTLGSIMTQGCDILPKGISSRMATSMWWFFSLIMTSSYTANLAAFLTMERMEPTIDSAEALSKQTKIKYGAVINGSTQAFFRESNYSTYQRMWINMESSKPTVFEKSNADGVARVKNGLYAFLMESTQIEYEIERECSLKQVGGWLDSKGYGIAMPLNSLYRSAINKAVLQLQEDGTLNDLKSKWWKSHDGQCNQKQEGGSSNELALANVGGVFLVLGVGVGIAFFLALLEFLWNVRNVSVEEHLTFFEALKVETKFACNIWITKKRTKPVISESSSSKSSVRTRLGTRSRSRSRSRSGKRSMARSILRDAGSFLNINESVVNRIGSRLNINE